MKNRPENTCCRSGQFFTKYNLLQSIGQHLLGVPGVPLKILKASSAGLPSTVPNTRNKKIGHATKKHNKNSSPKILPKKNKQTQKTTTRNDVEGGQSRRMRSYYLSGNVSDPGPPEGSGWLVTLLESKIHSHLKMVAYNKNLLFQRSIFGCRCLFQGGLYIQISHNNGP